MGNFKAFADQINHQFARLQKGRDLFVVDCTGDELYAHYLAAFPDGTNPLYRERTEYDCSNCKNFIRNFGGVIAIDPDDLSVQTVWDGNGFEYPYGAVAAQMREFIQNRGIRGLFRVSQPSFSAQKTVTLKDGHTETHHHFYGTAASKFVTRDGAQAGEYDTSVQVLTDSLARITPDAINTVLELINARQLYRGEEHLAKLEAFRTALARYLTLEPELRGRYIAATAPNLGVARFKNSVIGSLVEDIATGMDTEAAVRSFEAKVAPANYQRTAQIVTPRMVEEGLKFIEERGLNVARRLARLDDVSVNNVLWVSGEARPLMKDGLAGILAAATTQKAVTVNDKNTTEISIDAFMADVLPRATGVRLLVEPGLAGHFMTLTTADGEPGGNLFKWNNNFAWSYSGGVTDSIQERVKAAGGNIKALLRFSLSWGNYDDLDLHVQYAPLPGTRGPSQHIHFRDKQSKIPGLRGGLDVDMNAGSGQTRSAVENIAFTSLVPGIYQVFVHNFSKREAIDVGFTLQVADGANITNYTHAAPVDNGKNVPCVTTKVDANGKITFTPSKALTQTSSEVTGKKWGVDFGQFADVHTVMLSPNYWDDNAVGNKHYFFILKNAKTDEQPRGIYNEYLNNDLAKHRKVFDVIGEHTKPALSDEQLSGIGVSSTLRKSVVTEVSTTSSRRLYRIQF